MCRKLPENRIVTMLCDLRFWQTFRGEFPRPAYNEEAQGTVVIRIGVDARGNVISAEYHPAGSTTNNPTLVAEARKAAMGAKFSEKPDSDIQFGTITYIFRLR